MKKIECVIRPIKIDEVPANIRAIAEKNLPDVKFADGWKNLRADGSFDSYEIRGKNPNGKIREIRIDPDGKVLEME